MNSPHATTKNTSENVYDYIFYGLNVRTNVPIPHLHAESSLFDEPDVLCHFMTLPPYTGEWVMHDRFVNSHSGRFEDERALRILMPPDGSLTQLCYNDAIRFTLTPDAREMWIDWDDGQSIESISLYFLNPILGFCLRVRQQVCLHASAVDVDGGAILITAPSGSGKSTLAYRFSLFGFPVIADDVSVLTKVQDKIAVQPAYPYLRLWSDSIEESVDKDTLLPPISPEWDKRFFDLQNKENAFAQHPVPIRAIYFLHEARDLRIESVPMSQALVILMENAYMDYLLDNTLRKNDFSWLAQLASQVPVKHFIRPYGLEYLDEVVKTILADVAKRKES